MLPTVSDIIHVMETFAPLDIAEEWDNTGLQVGQMDWPVRVVEVALDPSLDVVMHACEKDVDLLITHHPLILKPLKSIDLSTPAGFIIHMALQNRMSLYAAHTNLDNAIDGVNDVLTSKIGLKNLGMLSKIPEQKNSNGPGRVGDLEKTIELELFARMIKEKLGLKSVKIAGKHNLPVNKVAVCAGSGSSLMEKFFLSGAQVYISGDLRYHDARAAEAENLGLIDIGHFASEHLIVDVLAMRLHKVLSDNGVNVKVVACGIENDPFTIL